MWLNATRNGHSTQCPCDHRCSSSLHDRWLYGCRYALHAPSAPDSHGPGSGDSLDLSQSLARLLSSREGARQCERRGELAACGGLVASPQVCHSEVVAHIGILRELLNRDLEMLERLLVDAPLIENPTEGVGHSRVVRRDLFRPLSKRDGLLLIVTGLGQDPGAVVGGHG